MPSDKVDYVRIGRTRILELLAFERAMVKNEIEAKLAEEKRAEKISHIDPHHLGTALRQLVAENLVREETHRTRGKRFVTTYWPDDGSPKRPILDAQARKRLLQARYLSYAQSSADGLTA